MGVFSCVYECICVVLCVCEEVNWWEDIYTKGVSDTGVYMQYFRLMCSPKCIGESTIPSLNFELPWNWIEENMGLRHENESLERHG